MSENRSNLRYSVSLVTQGRHRFYTLTMPSDVLARTCFVTNRFDDPDQGFQRMLDRKRAEEIATYIDTAFGVGLGTIPSSIVLSAQPDAELRVIGRGKTIEFRDTRKAFLILDGQHRVYGFSIAKTPLRVPVVIYNGLSRKDESRLFIDINTKQRPVPNELLLDIKKLAEYESDIESRLGQVFDLFQSQKDSPLIGLMSPSERKKGLISRVTFNAALRPLISTFGSNEPTEIYEALSAYVTAVVRGTDQLRVKGAITKPPIFRAVMLLFPDAAQRVKDRFGKPYTVDNFYEVLRPLFVKATTNLFKRPGNSYKELHDALAKALKTTFTI
jgi:DGQHR domain-containing protein